MAQTKDISTANRSWTRRRFLADMARAGAASPVWLKAEAVWAQAKNAPIRDTKLRGGELPSKAVLSGSDFTYLGAFRVPRTMNGGDAAWGRALAHRYVNGELRFFSMNVGQGVYEMDFPGLQDEAQTAPMARLVRFYGPVSKASWTGRHGDGSGTVFGLYWDPTDSRLYWAYGDTYNTTSPNDPSIGFSTLDDATGAVESVGCWQVGQGCKMTMGGITPIPDWFSREFTQGRRLGAGFGGYWSIVATGPASMGPALFAFAPPNPSTQRSKSGLPSTPLVSYPFNGQPYSQPDRCHRDTDYTTQFDGWNPRNGVGYWSWADYLWQGGVWIDLPDKHGLMFFPTLGNGRTFYKNSTINAERASHWWFIYDPMSLALVARGSKKPYQIQPSQRWEIKYPGAFTYPMPTWSDEPGYMVTGTTFDPTDRRLYIAVRFAYGSEPNVIKPENGTVIFSYQLNA